MQMYSRCCQSLLTRGQAVRSPGTTGAAACTKAIQPPAPSASPSPRLPHRMAYGDWPGLARRREREHGWVNHPGDGVERLMPKLLELAEFVRRIQDAVMKLHCVRVVH